MNIWLFAIIPLILSIGILPSLQSDIFVPADAAMAKSGTAKLVCGDKLCSEISSEQRHTYHGEDKSKHDKDKEKHGDYKGKHGESYHGDKEMMKQKHMEMMEKMKTMSKMEILDSIKSMMDKHHGMMIEKIEKMDKPELLKHIEQMHEMMAKDSHGKDYMHHKDSDYKHKTSEDKVKQLLETKGLFESAMQYTVAGPEIDPEKGYAVIEIGEGLYWITDGIYQMMFLTTGQGVIVVDAPMGLGDKINQAISDVTAEKVTHLIYTHIHKDHIGSASLLPKDTIYISHTETAEHLKMKNDPHRPIPTVTFHDKYVLNVGNQTLELSFIGNFHSKGDIVVYSPAHKVVMAVDLFHPNAAPFQYMGIARDMGEHIAAHDKLLEMDWDVIISGHEPILGTPEHLKFNKEFTLAVLDNAVAAMQTTQPSANYFGDLANKCAELTLEQYPDLKDIEVYPVENCVTMVFYAMID